MDIKKDTCGWEDMNSRNDMSSDNFDKLRKIEAQLRYWGIDQLNEEGIKKWTKDIYWLINKVTVGEQRKTGIEIALEQSNHDECKEVLHKVLRNIN